MIQKRSSDERGRTRLGWLDSRHTFSFGGYHDPDHMGFRHLRVINEDRVAPGEGFPTHPHRDMEILTYVLSGGLRHRDSLGNGSVIRPGEIQRMSAGTGIRHSELNDSDDEPVHFLQIWILPERPGLPPGYEERPLGIREEPGRLHLAAARDGREGAVRIHQDVDLYIGVIGAGKEIERPLEPGRHAWVQVARGAIHLNGTPLEEGDGASLSGEGRLILKAVREAEVLVFDLG